MSEPAFIDILAALQRRCIEISAKPTDKPCNGLVAFQDGVSFAVPSLTTAGALFDSGVDAIKARFRFARLAYESEHGPSDLFAEEYIALAQIGEGNQPTGQIEVRAQIVLKSLTAGAESIIDQINGKA